MSTTTQTNSTGSQESKTSAICDYFHANPSQAWEQWFGGVNLELRPYQQRIVIKAIQMLMGEYVDRHGHETAAVNSVLIESPTGSGKTVMGLLIARFLQNQLGLRVGWVAMRRNLLAQAEAENQKRNFGVDLRLISMFDKDPPVVDVLLVDEAQHDAATSMGNLHCCIKPRFVVGLTATPFRTDRIKLCFDRVITDAGIHNLIQDGFLSQYHHYTLPSYGPQEVAQQLVLHPNRWGKSLVFFPRYDQSFECLRLLKEAGIRSDVVTGSSPRERQLDDFMQGKTDVLINMNILTEGFDCPALKTVFCRPSGRGCTLQMAGRAFRKHDQIPFKQIVQCARTRHPMIRSAQAAEQYTWLEGEWKSLSVNREIDAMTKQMRAQISKVKVELPELLSKAKPKQGFWLQREKRLKDVMQ